jgi:arylsulfatase
VDFADEGKPGELGEGATVTMVNDVKVAEGQLSKTISVQISRNEGLDIGVDAGSPS